MQIINRKQCHLMPSVFAKTTFIGLCNINCFVGLEQKQDFYVLSLNSYLLNRGKLS